MGKKTKIDVNLHEASVKKYVSTSVKKNYQEDYHDISNEAKKISKLKNNNQFYEHLSEEIVDKKKTESLQKVLKKDLRVTTRFITKFEKARVLGVRATQISMGAPVMIDLTNETDPLEIALKEMLERKSPLIIRRILPGGKKYEDWKVNELLDFH